MFPLWRQKIRAARLALDEGRWHEASELLARESVREFLPAQRLATETAEHFLDRAEVQLSTGDSLAGWKDLQVATRLGGVEERIADVRENHARRGLQRVRELLSRGETALASEQIARLEQRRLGGPQRTAWKLVVQLIGRAKTQSQQGDFSAAIETLDRADRAAPSDGQQVSEEIASLIARLRTHAEPFRELTAQLHRQLGEEAWSEVLTTAEAMLELAPGHEPARQARARAWKSVGLHTPRGNDLRRPVVERPVRPIRNNRLAVSTQAWAGPPKDDTVNNPSQPGRRLLAWIDAVGGYLVCLENQVVLGQPAGGSGADIPILADLSRRHATIRREAESYVITPLHDVKLDGIKLVGPMVLRDNALLEMGAVRLRFHKPHALSSTAVLTLESHHKTEPAVDGIVLMSESCILGPGSHTHIRCRKWKEDVVLFRRGEEMHLRGKASLELDGEPVGTTAQFWAIVALKASTLP